MTLATFQQAFAAALYSGEGLAEAAQPGFRVYRNTVTKGCIDALQANFPAVHRLVGEDWFRDAAWVYVREQPPIQHSMLRYGATFANFLASFAPAQDLPYLADVARLDYLWLLAHVAADEPALARVDIAGLTPARLGSLRLRPHASAHWAWFADTPAFTIWDANRREAAVPAELCWQGEGALLVRRADAVNWMRLDRGTCGFLDACCAQRTLAEAAFEAQRHGADPGRLLQQLLAMGSFAAISAK